MESRRSPRQASGRADERDKWSNSTGPMRTIGGAESRLPDGCRPFQQDGREQGHQRQTLKRVPYGLAKTLVANSEGEQKNEDPEDPNRLNSSEY